MKKILFALAVIVGFNAMAQNEFIAYPATGKGVSSTFVTDYHCLGINPANLGWQAHDNKSVTLGTSEFGVSVYSESLSKQDLRDNIAGAVRNKTLDSLSAEEKLAAAEGFASDFSFNYDYNAFGISYQNPKFGGIAFSMRTRASWNSSFSDDFSDLLFRGKTASYFDSLVYVDGTDTTMILNSGSISTDSAGNVVSGVASVPLRLSELLNGSYLKLSLNREFHVGYGRRLLNIDSVFTLYVGVGAKYIQGIAMMDLTADDENGLQMYSAFSPGFDLNYGVAAANNPSALAETGAQFFKRPVGEGYGFDIGANATLFNKIHLAASITNVGSMTYTGNVYRIVDTLVVSYDQDGLDDMNIGEAPAEMLEEAGLLTIEGQAERTIKLPGQFRMGASIELGKFIEVGGELVAPFNDVPGNVTEFAYGLGGDVKLFGGKVFLMAGLTGGGGYATQIPLGVNFVLGGGAYELGIASRDAVTFFVSNSPTISTAFGFARVRF